MNGDDFAKNINFLIKKENIDIQRLCNNIDIDIDSFKLILKNKEDISVDNLIKIAGFFNISIDKLLNKKFSDKINFDFKLLALDIDGVMTDGGMYYTENGDQFKKFNTKDGMAIKILRKMGKKVAFISSGYKQTIVNERAKTLDIDLVYVGTEKKIDVLKNWCKKLNITLDNIAYIGDDINDLDCINNCGFTACPSDATIKIKNAVDVILDKKGGDAAVREFIENYLNIDMSI